MLRGIILLTDRRADRVVLHNIIWQQFENLFIDLGENRAARVAYIGKSDRCLGLRKIRSTNLKMIS
ncbi:hypothetical protein [Dendronalium phyllosphericum]|uniref:hypothetical protein n=1 Tax=Dendronalium phyllosphericum TaxID=2840445 RepID=UPI001CED2327|nr:hypothetical protein [Dendronalium phyllosphericum]